MSVTRIELEEVTVDDPTPSHITFDVGNLCAFDPTPVTPDITPGELLSRSQENVQHIINQILGLPLLKTEKTEKMRGRVYQLPEPTTVLPREKPAPTPKPLTRWERFKKERGFITHKKDKRAYDEATGTWKMRWGHDRANDEMKVQAIEVPDDWQPTADNPDPFTKLKRDKKARRAWNKEKQMRNIREAAGVRAPGTMHLASALEHSSKNKFGKKKHVPKDPKAHLNLALKIAQHSTRSMGKFDIPCKGEKVPPPMKSEKRRVRLSAAAEIDRNLEVLDMVVGKTTKKKVKFDKDHAARIEKGKMEQKRALKHKALGGRPKRRPESFSRPQPKKKPKT